MSTPTTRLAGVAPAQGTRTSPATMPLGADADVTPAQAKGTRGPATLMRGAVALMEPT